MNVHYFNNVGYLTHKFSDNELKPIRDEIFEIKENFSEYESQKHNQHLAGNIKREYSLKKCTEVIENLTYPVVWEFDRQFNYLKSIDLMVKDSPIKLSKCWVNFQKKGEFNPTHSHGGILSFILYIQIPFNVEDEMKFGPGKNSNTNVPGHLQFTYTNSLGNIHQQVIPVDKQFENTLFMFHSKLPHTVYPFFTSDEYRISVSGNYLLDNTKAT